jgi:hypothetical protein
MRFAMAFLFLVGVCSGCGGEKIVPAQLPTSNLHGGVLVLLPENGGYVELLNEGSQRRSGVNQTRIVAYVLQHDQKTAIAQQPTSVSVNLALPGGSKAVPLSLAPAADYPVGNARFASEPGPFELDRIGGEVTVAVGGKTLTGAFRGPR